MKFFASCVSLSLALLLTACGGGGGSANLASGYPSAPASCDVNGQRTWLRDYMNDQYYWYDRQATPNNNATSMNAYFDSLLFKPTDRYSGAQSTSSFTQFFTEGKRTGYGYSLATGSSGGTDTLTVRYTEPLAPVGALLKRGDLIISIDGLSPATIIANGLPAANTAGVSRSFVVTNPTDGTRSFTVASAEYTLSPVLATQVLTANGGRKVGYIAYNEFISTSSTPLAQSVDTLRNAAVQDVILDLRYNGGGSTLVAQNVAYLLGGSNLANQVFAQYTFNNKNTSRNFTQSFSNSSYTTPIDGLTRLFVITGGNTASASEMVINGLRPYRSVITVGSTTFGKPYAFQPRDACGITYNAVNIEIRNANGFGNYASGIPATCGATDDLTRQLGDPQEARTAAALAYINTGGCPTVASSISKENKPIAGIDTAQSATKSIVNRDPEQSLDENARPIKPGAVLLERPAK
jgi:carboxyl-terminal processing protease